MTELKTSNFEFEDVRVEPHNFKIFKRGSELQLEPKTFRLLLFLIENRARLIEKNELLDTVWKDTFVTENALTREIAKLRKALGDDSKTPKFIQTVHTQGYRFIAEVAETGDGCAGESESPIVSAQITESAAAQTEKQEAAGEIKRDKLVIVIALSILILAAIGFGFWLFTNRSPSDSRNAASIESIAVLPFVNESGNAEMEYLSDGMTETLISSLSQLPNLNVKARSSVFRYKGKETDAPTIGKELNVQAILNGRVLQRGEDLTLYLELVDTRTGNRIWGDQYNKKLINLISLQREIAFDVSQKLKTKLSGAEKQRLAENYTENAEAYQLYLKGRFYWNKRTAQDSRKASEYFGQAVALDPNYALAYSGIADAYVLLTNYGGAKPREVMPKAKDAALKALSLDDSLAEAHTSLGYVLFAFDYDFAGAEAQYKRAIELDPNYAAAHYYYGVAISAQGRHEESLAEVRRALEIEPLSVIANRIYADRLFFARQYDAAIAQLRKTLELDAGFVSAHYILSVVYQVKGDYGKCVEELAKYLELSGKPQDAALVRQSFARGGWRNFLQIMTSDYPLNNFSPRYSVAVYYAALNEKDKAFAELSKSYDEREYFITLLKVDPRLNPLRSDSRFQDLLREVGFPQ